MAGANAIATGSVVLAANADKAMTDLLRFGKNAEKWAKGLGAGLMTSMGGGMRGLATFAGGAIGGPLGGALGGAIAEVPAKFFDKIQGMAKEGNIAKALGMTSEQFTGMSGLVKSVGGDTREFIESLVTLNKVSEEGALGKGGRAAEFFEALNLNAKEFAALRPDEKFFKFYDALSLVEGQTKKAALSAIAFGDDGMKNLLPLLSKTPEELRKMAAQFAISDEKMRKVTDANEKLNEAHMKLEKSWENIVIAAAPVVEKFADITGKIVDMLPSVDSLTGKVEKLANGFKGLADSVASAMPDLSGIDKWLFGGAIGKPVEDAFKKIQDAVKNPTIVPPKALAPLIPEMYKAPSAFAGAILQDSKEAYSLEMRHKFGLTDKNDTPKKHLEEQKKTNKLLEKQNAMMAKDKGMSLKVIQ